MSMFTENPLPCSSRSSLDLRVKVDILAKSTPFVLKFAISALFSHSARNRAPRSREVWSVLLLFRLIFCHIVSRAPQKHVRYLRSKISGSGDELANPRPYLDPTQLWMVNAIRQHQTISRRMSLFNKYVILGACVSSQEDSH